MKLARITKPLRSVQVHFMLPGDLNGTLERYAQYYEHIHGEPVDTSADNQPRGGPAPPSSNGTAKTRQ